MIILLHQMELLSSQDLNRLLSIIKQIVNNLICIRRIFGVRNFKSWERVFRYGSFVRTVSDLPLSRISLVIVSILIVHSVKQKSNDLNIVTRDKANGLFICACVLVVSSVVLRKSNKFSNSIWL